MKKGFTLLELLTTLTLIVIIVSIVFTNSQRFVDRARDTRVKKQLDAVRNALEVYKLNHQGNPPAALAALYPDYLTRFDLSWEGCYAQGILEYDQETGMIRLKMEHGRPEDSEGKLYEEY